MSAESIEFFGGYTRSEVKLGGTSNHTDMGGWNASVTKYFSSHFGVSGDFAGFYATAYPALPPYDDASGVRVQQYSFMAGPQFRILRTDKFESSFRALVGGAHLNVPAEISNGTYNLHDKGSVAVLFGTQLFGTGVTIINGILLARLLGPEARGDYALLILVPSTAVALTLIGMTQAFGFCSARGHTRGIVA